MGYSGSLWLITDVFSISSIIPGPVRSGAQWVGRRMPSLRSISLACVCSLLGAAGVRTAGSGSPSSTRP